MDHILKIFFSEGANIKIKFYGWNWQSRRIIKCRKLMIFVVVKKIKLLFHCVYVTIKKCLTRQKIQRIIFLEGNKKYFCFKIKYLTLKDILLYLFSRIGYFFYRKSKISRLLFTSTVISLKFGANSKQPQTF